MENKNISINDLAKIRKIINLIINILENSIDDFSNNIYDSGENKDLIKFLIGSKDNVVSIITKLTNLLIKVIPLEEKINQSKLSDDEKLTNDDMEILLNYIERCGFLFREEK